MHVEHDDVGPGPAAEVDDLLAASGLADDADAARALEQDANTGTCHRMAGGDGHADRPGGAPRPTHEGQPAMRVSLPGVERRCERDS